MVEDVKSRLKQLQAAIDSLYIQENDHLTVLIDSNELHELRSCSKLLVAMAMGIAINHRLFSLDEEVYPYFERYVTNRRNIEKIKKWTIRTLLTHTTGYDKMLLKNKDLEELDSKKLVEYVLNYNIENDVNTTFVYNNVEPFLISVLFYEKHHIDLEEFIKINIFDPLDIKDYQWEKYGEYCPGGTGAFLFPKDFHKLGLLILNYGKYHNYQVVPSAWISEMSKIQIETPSMTKKGRVFPKYYAGYYMFTSRDGFIFRDGYHGQYLLIHREKNLLISIMSSEKYNGNATEMFRGIL